MLAIGAASAAPTPLPACTVGLDLSAPYVPLPFGADASGTFSTAFGLPADPSWWGLTLRLQAATIAGGALQIANAVDVVFGY